MPDQANDLRQLVRQCAAPGPPGMARRPRRVVVAGGKGGVGTTTIAVNLAAALVRDGSRTVLIDAAGGDASILCRLDPRYTLADVLSGARTPAEVIQAGPGNMLVLPGMRELEKLADYPPAALDRLLGQEGGFGERADLLVLDAGNTPHRAAQWLARAADLLLLLTTPEPTAIMGVFAVVKLLAGLDTVPPMHLLVNKTPRPKMAEDVHARLAEACRRFLANRLESAGYVPADEQVAAAGASGELFVAAAPGCPASRQLGRLAQAVAAGARPRASEAA